MRKVAVFGALLSVLAIGSAGAADKKPLMKEFMGINGHYHFKPELYSQVCGLVRNYHNIDWDLGEDSSADTQYPFAVNKVNWKSLYSGWNKKGFEVDICAQFSRLNASKWKDPENDGYKYGKAMAKFFGPSGKNKLCTSIEIGNEPGTRFDDEVYQKVFIGMAKGIRAGDRKVKIVTCTAHSQKADKYSKNLKQTFGKLRKYYDVINIHSYAQAEGWPTWKRSYPEDEKINYLKVINETIDWRNKNAREKEVWVTEFGYDACTPDVMKKRKNPFQKWQGVSDEEQARYIVRSFLVFSELDMDRAYLYFFNDSNTPQVHGCAGLTRNFKPKKSFWAVKHLYETLGDYRFSKIVTKQSGKLYVYEFKHGKSPKKIWVAWSPTGSGRSDETVLNNLPSKPKKVELMPMADTAPKQVAWTKQNGRSIKLQITEDPVYIQF